MFAFVIYGAILDVNPGATGFHYVFGLMIALALIGSAVATKLARIAKSISQARKEVEPA